MQPGKGISGRKNAHSGQPIALHGRAGDRPSWMVERAAEVLERRLAVGTRRSERVDQPGHELPNLVPLRSMNAFEHINSEPSQLSGVGGTAAARESFENSRAIQPGLEKPRQP